MSETAAGKPAFRDALRLRRCLIPVDSFYEWQSIGPTQKQPFSIGMGDDSVFAFAGLWESWADAKGDVIESCTILTTAPNALVAEVHNRMPVILRVEEYAHWLDPSINNPSLVRASLKPFDPALMKKYPVNTRVNRPENDDHECGQKFPSQSLQPCSDPPDLNQSRGTAPTIRPLFPQFHSQIFRFHAENCVDIDEATV
jgi:putative SOS response-associated peptidase YedK